MEEEQLSSEQRKLFEQRKVFKEQYERAIKARDTLKDDYHKWMTYYYLANGAILVAFTQLKEYKGGLLILSIIGTSVCILWNLSCRGYYYWSNNWIQLISKLERSAFEKKEEFVYSVFSQQVAEEEKRSSGFINGANISTPKLTMYLSLFAIICWASSSVFIISLLVAGRLCASLCRWTGVVASTSSIMFLIAGCSCYWYLRKKAISRHDNVHLLIDTSISNERFDKS